MKRAYIALGLVFVIACTVIGYFELRTQRFDITLDTTPVDVMDVFVPTEATQFDNIAPEPYYSIIEESCAGSVIPSWIVARLLLRESGFDQTCISYNADSIDIGICQFNSEYLDWFWFKYGSFDPLNPVEAIPAAVKHLEWLYEKTGHIGGAIAAWNCGLTRWKAGGKLPAITVKHVNAVLDI